jgi:hypothetical protein
LPMFQYRDELLKAVEEHQVLIIVGETGSGEWLFILLIAAGLVLSVIGLFFFFFFSVDSFSR